MQPRSPAAFSWTRESLAAPGSKGLLGKQSGSDAIDGSKPDTTPTASTPAAAEAKGQRNLTAGAGAEAGGLTLEARLEAAAKEASTAAAATSSRAASSHEPQTGQPSTRGASAASGDRANQHRLSIPFVALPDIPQPPESHRPQTLPPSSWKEQLAKLKSLREAGAQAANQQQSQQQPQPVDQKVQGQGVGVNSVASKQGVVGHPQPTVSAAVTTGAPGAQAGSVSSRDTAGTAEQQGGRQVQGSHGTGVQALRTLAAQQQAPSLLAQQVLGVTSLPGHGSTTKQQSQDEVDDGWVVVNQDNVTTAAVVAGADVSDQQEEEEQGYEQLGSLGSGVLSKLARLRALQAEGAQLLGRS